MIRILRRYLKLKGLLLGLDWTFASYYPMVQFYEKQNCSKKQRAQMRWAHRHGFFYERISEFGLTKHNYRKYLPDFLYYKLHPINLVASMWMDDKLTVRFVLQPFSLYFPEYYFHINFCQESFRIFEGRTQKNENVNVSMKEVLLKIKKQKVIVKGRIGSRSKGVYTLEYKNDSWFIEDKKSTKEEVLEKLKKTEDAIVQKYIVPHRSLPKNFEKLRLIMFRNKGELAQAGAAYMDLDCGNEYDESTPYYVDILCKVDLTTGHYHSPRKIRTSKPDCEDRQKEPLNTLESIQQVESMEGDIPHWNLLLEQMKEIFYYAPEMVYFGADIIITQEGFKILELNSLPDLEVQMFYPFGESSTPISKFFQERISKIK